MAVITVSPLVEGQWTALRIPLGDSYHDWLEHLPGPCYFDLLGSQPGPWQAMVTLLHGNEPSGLKALHKVLHSNIAVRHTTRVIIASVEAARTEPRYTHRMPPNARDLNRCFDGPIEDAQGQLAADILSCLRQAQPSWIIDVHNTSGSGPGFCVSTANTPHIQHLASVFAERLIVTDIRLGSLMEQSLGCPIVTVEAGGANDPHADLNAYQGIVSLLSNGLPYRHQRPLEVLHHPRRLEIKPHVRITYAERREPGFNMTFCRDIERFNHGITPAGQTLAWLDRQELNDLCHLDRSDMDVGQFFSAAEGVLRPTRDLKLFMITNRADIALSDCLCYFVPA
ncbi:succinylglutamate desuccinylase/aspartoacylase family protein [Aestuariibacter halophilus]|uniref:Succinylglutamate desuccinylase/aspartoacylase family protein n=1 Tax=Fluctibacter halophilus TaxID=226011 RepID=A0ABS8G7L0_9ALTE|nr:succinylglutamate desuccinylase/aspartoacylase family protein [Aestuariibacter halophilus]MCC2616577.1 succinylglutamate desuccinylase/aspartoacylase family protein [Aestuariibacter halophilus]